VPENADTDTKAKKKRKVKKTTTEEVETGAIFTFSILEHVSFHVIKLS